MIKIQTNSEYGRWLEGVEDLDLKKDGSMFNYPSMSKLVFTQTPHYHLVPNDHF